MGMSIDIHVYDINQMKSALKREHQIEDFDLFDKIMSECGYIQDNKFLCLYSDYHLEDNPDLVFGQLVESAYNLEDEEASSIFDYEFADCGRDKEEIAKKLGIKLKDSEE